jgi:L-fucose mutarotase
MPLNGIPPSITPEVLYALAKMGHGDLLVIADANFPADSVATNCVIKEPLRMQGTTDQILRDLLVLFPLDQYVEYSARMMDRVPNDKARNLEVIAYETTREVVSSHSSFPVEFVERFAFYNLAKKAFCVIQSTDQRLYANIIISKGVI